MSDNDDRATATRKGAPEVVIDFNDPGLWPAAMSDSDRVNAVRALATRASLSEVAKDLPIDVDGRTFPSYLCYAMSPNGSWPCCP